MQLHSSYYQKKIYDKIKDGSVNHTGLYRGIVPKGVKGRCEFKHVLSLGEMWVKGTGGVRGDHEPRGSLDRQL